MRQISLREIRRYVRSLSRTASDILTGRQWRFARTGSQRTLAVLPTRLSVYQPIQQDEGSDAKRHNISRAAEVIHTVAVQPGEIFSFWSILGRPTLQRGYRAGRSLLGGSLVLDEGGGLCQLAGMLYLLALHSGLEILERHSHSRDIYTDETRYTPLGSDAAVAYGFKDLRIVNTLPSALSFRIDMTSQEIIVSLCSLEPLSEYHLEFVGLPVEQPACKAVVTYRYRVPDGVRETIGISSYR